MIIPVVNTLVTLNARTATAGGQGKPKQKAHAVQPSTSPAPGHTQGEAIGYTIFSGVVLTLAVLFLASWVAVIRFVWKRARRPPLPEGGWWRQGR